MKRVYKIFEIRMNGNLELFNTYSFNGFDAAFKSRELAENYISEYLSKLIVSQAKSFTILEVYEE